MTFYSFEVVSFRFYVMGYYTLLLILNVLALKKIYHYNPTKKSMKKYITQPYKSNNNDDTIMISVYSDSEISILINKFPLKNIFPKLGILLLYNFLVNINLLSFLSKN